MGFPTGPRDPVREGVLPGYGFIAGEPGVSGDFWGSQEGCQLPRLDPAFVYAQPPSS